MRHGLGIDRKTGLAALALALTAFAAPAQANTAPITAYYVDPALVGYTYAGPDKAIIQVNVTASIGGICGFATAPNATVTKSNIDTVGWTEQVALTPQCTAPWNIAVASQKGALESPAGIAPGYANRAPYTVALNIPYDTGSSNGTVSDSCAVKDLNPSTTTAACSFDGTASTSNGLTVPRSFNLSGAYLQVSAPAYSGPGVLVQGTYTDTLIVTVSPAI